LDNITVDSTNIDLIHYSGNWTTSIQNSFDYGGTHQWSSDPSASATFTFTGVGVYYLSSLFNHAVTSQISIDGNPAQFLNLTSPAGGGGNQDVASTVVWGVEQLSNAPHNVVVSMAPGGGYVEVDAFIYSSNTESTASSQPSTTSPSSSSSSSTGPVSASNTRGSHTNIGAVAGGTLAGLVVIVVIVLLLWKSRKKTGSGMQIDARGANFFGGVPQVMPLGRMETSQ